VTAPRVALVSPFWSFWERTVPFDLRADRAELARAVAGMLGDAVATADESLDSLESARAAADRIATADPDVLLVVQSMAVPPAYTYAALEALPDIPVVVWAVHRRRELPAALDHADITTEGATVGTSQLANVLGRRGRRWLLVVGPLDDERTAVEITRAVGAAAAARRLRAARIGLVGAPQDGYECVECDPADLAAATGITIVPVRPAAFRDAYLTATTARVASIEQELRSTFAIDPATGRGEGLSRSVRCAAALEDLVRDERLDAGAMNCHVPEIRLGPEPGIAPCLALGRETSSGRPWTCTGDVPTAVAMLTAKLLGVPTLYHELESIDYATGELAVANTGEHDLGWTTPGEQPRLIENAWFASDPCTGACACFGLRPGPATLLAFTPHADEPSGFRFVVAEGEITDRRFSGAGTPNGAFRFAGQSAVDGYTAWALAGASHHSCISTGLLATEVGRIAGYLGVGCLRVDGGG
jgi:L-arabinose isomerase